VNTLAALAVGIGGVLAAIVALTDPQRIVIGGTWGTHPRILDAIQVQFAALPTPSVTWTVKGPG